MGIHSDFTCHLFTDIISSLLFDEDHFRPQHEKTCLPSKVNISVQSVHNNPCFSEKDLNL